MENEPNADGKQSSNQYLKNTRNQPFLLVRRLYELYSWDFKLCF